MELSRRGFLTAAPGACAAASILGAGSLSRASGQASGSDADPGAAALAAFPRQDIDAVRETVGASHRNFDRVKELVSARPALAKATYDWGFGDWESALGAAAHTGRRQIAEFLLEHGARPDIFAFAMLGDLNAVKAMIEARPGVQRIPGPHGIPLLRHAQAGGDQANAVVEYLQDLGDAGIEQESLPLPDDQRAAYLGTFELEGGGGVRFEIKDRNGQLILDQGGSFRNLFHQGNHEFHPTGAKAVRIRFGLDAGQASRVTIADGPAVLAASRI